MYPVFIFFCSSLIFWILFFQHCFSRKFFKSLLNVLKDSMLPELFCVVVSVSTLSFYQRGGVCAAHSHQLSSSLQLFVWLCGSRLCGSRLSSGRLSSGRLSSSSRLSSSRLSSSRLSSSGLYSSGLGSHRLMYLISSLA